MLVWTTITTSIATALQPSTGLWRRSLLSVGVPCLDTLEHFCRLLRLPGSKVRLFTLIVRQVEQFNRFVLERAGFGFGVLELGV